MGTGKEAEFKTEIASVHPFQNMFNSIQCTEIRGWALRGIKSREYHPHEPLSVSEVGSSYRAPLLFLSWFLLVSMWLCRQVFTFYLDLELWAISFFHHRMQSLKCCATVTQDRLCQRHYWGPWGPPPPATPLKQDSADSGMDHNIKAKTLKSTLVCTQKLSVHVWPCTHSNRSSPQ